LVASALAFTLYYWLLEKTRVVTIASMIYVTQVVALMTGWFVFREPISLRTVGGILLIFAGIAISELSKYRSQLSRKRQWR
jgi:drug/metabolite transporter (DMT)-like permease